MAKRYHLFLLFISAIFALFATVLIVDRETKASGDHKIVHTVSVVMVVKPVAAHTVVQASDVQIQQMTPNDVTQNAIHSLDQAIGKYTTISWLPGQAVVEGMVTPTNVSESFPLSITKGYRAVTISDDAVTGVDHLISVGDYVDLVVTLTSQGSNKPPVTETLIQNIQVLAVDRGPLSGNMATVGGGTGASSTTSFTGTSSTSSSTASSSGSAQAGSDTITLAVRPSDAERLIDASVAGQIRLILRNPSDKQESAIPAVSINHP